jgi:hypothetical protein
MDVQFFYPCRTISTAIIFCNFCNDSFILLLNVHQNFAHTYILKAIKEMRNRKATGDDDVPGDGLKLLGEGGLKTLTKLINTIYETGEWSKDFTEVTMIVKSSTMFPLW